MLKVQKTFAIMLENNMSNENKSKKFGKQSKAFFFTSGCVCGYSYWGLGGGRATSALAIFIGWKTCNSGRPKDAGVTDSKIFRSFKKLGFRYFTSRVLVIY